MPDPRILTWDCREQPDLADLAAALAEVSNGTVHLTEVDTGDDQYAIVLDSRPVTKQEAYEMYRSNAGYESWEEAPDA